MDNIRFGVPYEAGSIEIVEIAPPLQIADCSRDPQFREDSPSMLLPEVLKKD